VFGLPGSLLFGLVLGMWPCLARAGSLTAELNRTEGTVDDTFVLTLSAEGVRDGDPTVPEVAGLAIEQQGVSESTVYSNGRRTSELQINYVVTAEGPGTYTIPSLKLSLDGKQEATVPLTLKVRGTGQSAPSSGSSSGSSGGGSAAVSGGQPSAALAAKARKAAKDTGGVFIERECDKQTPVVGEQVMCVIRVYHRGNLSGGQRLSDNTADFRRFTVDGEKRYQRVMGGQRYGVIELREVVVPTRSGHLELAPFSLDARILTWNRQGNPLDKFFNNFGGGVFNFDMNFTQEKEVTIKSDKTVFNVKPLPTTGKPAGFAGLVGDFKLTAAVSKQHLAVGDQTTVTVKIAGDGILDTAPDLQPASLAAIGKVYADKPEFKDHVTDQGVTASRTYKYALVPSKSGKFDLGSLVVPVFNPRADQYVTLKADLGQLIVDPGQAEEKPLLVGAPNTTPPTGATKEAVKVLGKDLISPHKNVDLTSSQTITNKEKTILVAFGGLPLFAAFASFGVSTLRQRQENDPEQKRRSRAHRVFQVGCTAARRHVDGGLVEAGLSTAYSAFRDYLGDKAGLNGRALAARDVEQTLVGLGVPAGTREQVRSLLARLEAVEFGGRVPAPSEAAQWLDSLEQLAGGIEKA